MKLLVYLVVLVVMQTCVMERPLAQGDTILEELVLTQEEVDSFVNMHNHFRRVWGSSNIRLMSWDKDIAKIAEQHSRGCTFAHSTSPLPPTAPFQRLGENLYTTKTSSSFRNRTKVLNSVKSWYDEVEDYNLRTRNCAANKLCGHYTQVVWSKSYKLGCGATICKPSGTSYDHQFIVVCNYGPAGNFNGEAPYTEGSSCSECSDTSDVCVTGLCANSNRGDAIPVQPSSTSSAPPPTSSETPQTSSTSSATLSTSSSSLTASSISNTTSASPEMKKTCFKTISVLALAYLFYF